MDNIRKILTIHILDIIVGLYLPFFIEIVATLFMKHLNMCWDGLVLVLPFGDNLVPQVKLSEPQTQSLIKLTVTSRWSHSAFAPYSPHPSPHNPPNPPIVAKTLSPLFT